MQAKLEYEAKKSMSFADYKIDYSRPLGEGVFGTVYPVVPRPENEKGIFSYLFPYVYDWLFRSGSFGTEPGQYCVKIAKTSLRMIYENPSHPFRFKLPWHSFFEAAKEKNTNQVLQKNGMTNIRFFKTNSFYAQFKTRVNGRTLHHYLEDETFISPDAFILRKSFVDFMRSINHPKFTFWDIHEYNLMYDELNQQWEIVDGIFNEVGETTGEKQKDNLNFFLANLLQSTVSHEVNYWLESLANFAREQTEYTKSDDQAICSAKGHNASIANF
ncbi:hypothetical protein [Legionella cardiaca]|uniref:Dot/Icm T4SS effector n=1 Tax=Legionella cardiaca TaxID=1071983 RepID=A0ABY8ARS3_9GAMM|nr:hypothetical protein [Legionella cardiaca]WED43365.1 hypothetical protein PXX05_00905 [Legionella cardiaca]